ncbi:hypothetical protein ACFWMU_10095 [Streptomyces sp. NPDC058357]|uniref:hypothetical protein n=1 Tax=unclassified Streptomyces TaxID=2593676 RepID=UPI003660D7F6
MENPSKGPGGSFIEGEHAPDPTMVFTTLMSGLSQPGSRSPRNQAREAVEWVSDTLGIAHHDLVQTAGCIGHPDAPSITLNEGMERYGNDPMTFVLYMPLPCGGVVATVGDGDPDRLRQSDLTN